VSVVSVGVSTTVEAYLERPGLETHDVLGEGVLRVEAS
jgi:hypothetical protein